jgi:hypothetical protein
MKKECNTDLRTAFGLFTVYIRYKISIDEKALNKKANSFS